MPQIKILHPSATTELRKTKFVAFGWARPRLGKLEIRKFELAGRPIEGYTAHSHFLRREGRTLWVIQFTLPKPPADDDKYELTLRWTVKGEAYHEATAAWAGKRPAFGGTIDYPAANDPMCADYAVAYGTVDGGDDPVQGAEMLDTSSVVTVNDFLFNQDGFWCVTFPPLAEDVYALTVITSAGTLGPVTGLDVSTANCG